MHRHDKSQPSGVSGQGKTFTHSWLYVCAKLHLKNAKENEEGRFHYTMSCIVFSAFAIEAYFNYLGNIHVEDWERQERHWSKWKKLRHFTEGCGNALNKSERPASSIVEAFEFRDLLAHGRTTTSREPSCVEYSEDGHTHIIFESDWMKFCRLENAERIFEDLVAYASRLHEGYGHGRYPFLSMYSGSYSASCTEAIAQGDIPTSGTPLG